MIHLPFEEKLWEVEIGAKWSLFTLLSFSYPSGKLQLVTPSRLRTLAAPLLIAHFPYFWKTRKGPVVQSILHSDKDDYDLDMAHHRVPSRQSVSEFNIFSPWLSAAFDCAILLDDSWSVGAIDFSREIQFTKLILNALNPKTQRSSIWLYRNWIENSLEQISYSQWLKIQF